MMIKKPSALTAIIILSLSLYGYSAEFSKIGVTIQNIHAISGDRPAAPNLENYLSIGLSPGAWSSSTTCREDVVLLHKDDNHVLSLLLTGYTIGKTFRMYIDDLKFQHNNICTLTGAKTE